MRDNRQTNEEYEDRRTDEEVLYQTPAELDRRTVAEVKRDHARIDQIAKTSSWPFIAGFIVHCVVAYLMYDVGFNGLATVLLIIGFVWPIILVYARVDIKRLCAEELERAERLERERAEEERIFEEAKGVNFGADVNISVGAPEPNRHKEEL